MQRWKRSCNPASLHQRVVGGSAWVWECLDIGVRRHFCRPLWPEKVLSGAGVVLESEMRSRVAERPAGQDSFTWPRAARSGEPSSERSVTLLKTVFGRRQTDPLAGARRPLKSLAWSSPVPEFLHCKPERLRGTASPHRARKGCKTGGECGAPRFCWD
jgi:hypothetical protein